MTPKREGVSPLSSERLLKTVCDALRTKGVFESLLGEEMLPLVDALVRLQPSHHLVDAYLEQSLVGNGSSPSRALMVLDSTESRYLHHQTGGIWHRRVGLPDPCADELPARLSCLVCEGGHVEPCSLVDRSYEVGWLAEGNHLAQVCSEHDLPDAVPPKLPVLLRHVSGMLLRARWCRGDRGFELLLAPVRTGVQQRFSRAPYQAQLLALLRDCGCDERRLCALARASFVYGFPFLAEQGQQGRWLVSVDLGYLAFRWREGRLSDIRAGVCVSDRTESFDGLMIKPANVYQWHITDNCDQRCKHCYLFAEDAQMRCMSTPWDKLMHTLDEVERAAAHRNLLPMLAVSGGDPILHPRFWDFAAELRRRGILWSAMGNPFHLSEEACLRLRQMGCYKYQLSLDGLEAFHDHLRKPGSYQATLAAVGPLHAAGIKVQLMATASRQNLNDILACMDVAMEHGADSFAFARYCATSPEKAAELYPTAEEYRAFLLAYWNKKQSFERSGCKTAFKTKDHLFRLLRWELGVFEVPAFSREHPDRVCGGCHLGGKATIAVNGDLLACRRMDSVVGNVWTQGLLEVDESPAMKAYAEVAGIEKCRDCELLMWCRGCRAVGVNATGNLQAADPMCWKA